MNEAEEAINKLFHTIDKRFFPEHTVHEISDCIYRCDYTDALWHITEYIDMFDEEEVQLLVKSWTLIRQYHLLKLQEFQQDWEKYCANGMRRGIMAQGTILSIEEANMSLGVCEKGQRTAKLVQQSRQDGPKRIEIKPILSFKQQQQQEQEPHDIWHSFSSWSQTGILFLS